MRKQLAILAVSAALAGGAMVPQAHAIGCLSGGAAGAVAGHYAHHHAIIGAMAGCAVGHHLAVKHKRELRAKNAAEKAQAQANRVSKPVAPPR